MLVKGKPYRKFIILSSPRSGTHMLRTTLRNHSEIVARTELFNPDFLQNRPFGPDTPAKEILSKYIFKDYPRNINTVGFIIHRSGTPFGDWPDLWPMLEANQQIFVISLRRRNLLRRYLSYQVMRTFRGTTPSPLKFDPEVLENDFRCQQEEVDTFDQRFAHHPLIKIYYEDLCDDYQATVEKVQKFLKVKPQLLWPEIEGKPQRKLSEAIANFEELKTYFSSSQWASFFNDKEEVTHISRPEKKVVAVSKPNPILEQLSNSKILRPYIYLRNRYQQNWTGLFGLLLNGSLSKHYCQLVKGKDYYFKKLPQIGWAFYSEKIEELLIRSFFRDQRKGVFLDIGCAWPITNSNTFYLEKYLAWSGLAVDANPVDLQGWKKYRPQSTLLTYIVSDHTGKTESFYKAGPLGSTQKERTFGKKVVRGKEISLSTITINQLLEDQQIEKIDFLSIDIEGSELKALKGFDIVRFQPSLVCIEVSQGNIRQVTNYFEKNAYKLVEDYKNWDNTNLYFVQKKEQCI